MEQVEWTEKEGLGETLQGGNSEQMGQEKSLVWAGGWVLSSLPNPQGEDAGEPASALL